MQGFHHIAATVAIGAMLFASSALAAGSETPQPNAQTSQQPAAAAQPQADQSKPSITEQRFGQWALQCSSDKSMNPPCQIMYRLASADGKQVAAVISMAKAAQGDVGMQMALPLGFAVQKGVKIDFGPRFSTVASVSRCTAQGCLVEGLTPKNMLAAMLKEKSGLITVQMMEGKSINLPVQLDGFSQAYQAMSGKS